MTVRQKTAKYGNTYKEGRTFLPKILEFGILFMRMKKVKSDSSGLGKIKKMPTSEVEVESNSIEIL